jgi:hypothetical protein
LRSVDRNFSRQMLEPSISFDLGICDASRSVFELPPHFSAGWANHKQALLEAALPRTAVDIQAAAGIISQRPLPSPPFCSVLLVETLPPRLGVGPSYDALTKLPRQVTGRKSRAPLTTPNTMTTPSPPSPGIAIGHQAGRQTCAVGNTSRRAAIEDLRERTARS